MQKKVLLTLLATGALFGYAAAEVVPADCHTLKRTLLSTLRDKSTNMEQFRDATERIAYILAYESSQCIKSKNIIVETQLGPSSGTVLDQKIVLVPILRSGLTLLRPFEKMYKNAKVGFIGLERNEETAIARKYYANLPKDISKDDFVIVLEPMLATGGSAIKSIEIIKEEYGVKEENILFATVVAATEGIKAVKTKYPKVKILPIAIDEKLNDKKFIVPGLGDYGDRYYGTENIEKVK
jgi:uracil phosphoribosyltransferase